MEAAEERTTGAGADRWKRDAEKGVQGETGTGGVEKQAPATS